MQGNINIPDSTITTNLSFRQLVLMNMQQLTNFPYIEKDFDALTDYELLCLVVKFLNDVIANQNEQNDSITRMYESFLALQTYVNNTKDTLEDAFNSLDNYVRDYFANLDVQEEIDHKLDEMVEDGTLQEIINNFLKLNSMLIFDNVNAMKNATSIANGSFIHTLGFYTKNDFGSAYYEVVDTATANEKDIIALQDDLFAILVVDNCVIPEQFGAYGDNIHDDTSVIQYIFDNTPIKKPIKLFGQYKITTGILTNKPRNIYSNIENAGFYGSTNDYILKFTKDESESADYRNNYIKNIVVQQSGTGNGLMFSNWGARIIEMKIENCKLAVPYTGAVGYALYCEDSLGHCVISGCNIQGNGIYGELQDANVIQKNLIFGEGNGIKLNIPAGCLNNTIKDNTIVNFGGNAIHIEKGDQILIDNNQIEYQGTYNQTTTTKGMIYITSDYSTSTRRCIHPTIINNNLGGGTHLDYLITLNNCLDAVIDNNRLVACNTAEIYIGSNTQNTQIRTGNYGVSQTSNPRTDANNRYIVENHGYNTTNYWNTITIQNLNNRNLQYMKDDNCYIHFKPCYLESTSTTTLCQLPVGYRPTQNIKFPCYVDSSDTQIMATINLNGTITLDSIPAAGVLYMPITYQAIKYS